MSGWSVNLTTLFLGRLRPPKRVNLYFVHILSPVTDKWPFLKKRKEKRKYVARPGIEPMTPDLRVRCPTDCSTRPGFCASKELYDKLYLTICIYLASETLYEGHEKQIVFISVDCI